MTELPIHAATRNDLAGNPQLSGGPAAAQLQRFLALEDILIGFGEGIDGARLEAGLTWAKHGDAQANRDALARLFASRWIAAQEEGEWEGDATAEGARDLDELTAVAAALATRPAPETEKTRLSAGTHWWNPDNDEEGFSCWGDAFEDATFYGRDGPVRLERAARLPDVWAACIDLDTDGDGEVDDHEIHLFSTEQDALAALQAEQKGGQS